MPKFFSMLALLLLSFISACSSNELDFVIRYDNINGLLENDSIIHDENIIGKVSNITRSDSGAFDVHVSIDQEKMGNVTHSANFVIIPNPHQTDGHAIRLMSQDPKSRPIAPDEIIQGATELEGFAHTLKHALSSEWNNISGRVDKIISSINGADVQEEIKPIESEIDKIIKEIDNLSKSSKDKLENEVLPKIKDQINKLKERLEALGEDQALDPLNKKLDSLERTIEA